MSENRNYQHDPTRPVSVEFLSTFSPKHGATVGESLGSEALAGHLMGTYGDSVAVGHTDLQLDPDIDAWATRIANQKPDMIGVSVKIGALDQTDQVMQALGDISTHDYRPLVVMGGVLPTFATAPLQERYRDAVMAVKEGENAIQGLVQVVRGERQLSQVPGIWYRDQEGTPRNTLPQRLDLSRRHLPARLTTRRIDEELHGTVWAEGSRGCDFNCTFCSIRQLHGGGFDGDVTPESIVEDQRRLKAMGINAVSYTDDDFMGDPERAAQIAGLLREANLGMKFSVSTRADHVWNEGVHHKNTKLVGPELDAYNNRLVQIVKDLRDVGLVRVFMGMESGSPTQLRRYGKQVTVDGNYKAIEILRGLGIDVVAGYIPIDYLMTLQELEENMDFLKRTEMGTKITNPLSVLRVQAGSPYLKMAENEGVLGEMTDDLVFYKAQFKDRRVQQIAESADRWVQEMYPFIFGLKGEVANVTMGPGGNRTPEANAVEQALFGFRKLEMDYVTAMTRALREDPTSDLRSVTDEFVGVRSGLVKECQIHAARGDFGENHRLLDVINQFCNR